MAAPPTKKCLSVAVRGVAKKNAKCMRLNTDRIIGPSPKAMPGHTPDGLERENYPF